MVYYSIIDNAIKGRCCIATCAIEENTIILVDFPIMVIPSINIKKFVINTIKSNGDLLEQILNLAPVTKNADINLSNFEKYYKLLITKINTNSFDFAHNDNKSLLYYNASLFNHSCEPNLDHYTDGYSNRLVCKTNRNIEVGEELCINYVGGDFDVISRKKIIFRNWNFNCVCDKCNSDMSLLTMNKTKKYNEQIAKKIEIIQNKKDNFIKKISKKSLILQSMAIFATFATFVTFDTRMINSFS